MKKILLTIAAALSLTALLSPARAINFKHQEDIGVEQPWFLYVSSTALSIGVQTLPYDYVIPGWVTGMHVQTEGGVAQFSVLVSTAGASDTVNTSSTVYVSAASEFVADFKGQVFQPTIRLSSLQAGTTLYMHVEYLKPRGLGF